MSLNQPKKLFVSSDDADYADDDTSAFSVTLSQPIHNAQSVRLVSAVYPSSVYNVEDGDTLRVNESYYTSDGTKLSSVQFVLSVPSGNYTGDTLATAITTAFGVPALLGHAARVLVLRQHDRARIGGGDGTDQELLCRDPIVGAGNASRFGSQP